MTRKHCRPPKCTVRKSHFTLTVTRHNEYQNMSSDGHANIEKGRFKLIAIFCCRCLGILKWRCNGNVQKYIQVDWTVQPHINNVFETDIYLSEEFACYILFIISLTYCQLSQIDVGPRRDKTCLRGLRQSQTKTSLLSYRTS